MNLTVYRNPSCNIEHIQSTMGHIYLGYLLRRNTKDSKIAGRDTMAVPTRAPDQVVCRYDNTSGGTTPCSVRRITCNVSSTGAKLVGGALSGEMVLHPQFCNPQRCRSPSTGNPTVTIWGISHSTTTLNPNIEFTAGGNDDPNLSKKNISRVAS